MEPTGNTKFTGQLADGELVTLMREIGAMPEARGEQDGDILVDRGEGTIVIRCPLSPHADESGESPLAYEVTDGAIMEVFETGRRRDDTLTRRWRAVMVGLYGHAYAMSVVLGERWFDDPETRAFLTIGQHGRREFGTDVADGDSWQDILADLSLMNDRIEWIDAKRLVDRCISLANPLGGGCRGN